MGNMLLLPDVSESQPDRLWQQRFATVSETVDNIIGLTSTLGVGLKDLLSNVRRIEEVSSGLQEVISRLPAGEARQQLEHQQTLINEQLVIARRLLTGF
jgi:hypothetical protein